MQPTKNSDFSTNLKLVPRPYSELNYTQQMYIDWKALNGLVIEETDDSKQPIVIRKMPLTELASRCGVTIDAFAKAKESVPNFWELVAGRREALNGESRLARVHETWYLKAVIGDWQHLDAWLRNFDSKYKPANVKVEHELGDGMADALNLARERSRQIGNIQEGEVVDVRQTDN